MGGAVHLTPGRPTACCQQFQELGAAWPLVQQTTGAGNRLHLTSWKKEGLGAGLFGGPSALLIARGRL